MDAGRALRRFDARGQVSRIRQPAAIVVTTADRLVLPRKQRALAEALDAATFDIDGDHDVAITDGDASSPPRSEARSTTSHDTPTRP